VARAITGGVEVYGLKEFRLAIRREQAQMPAEVTKLVRNMGNRFKREMRQKMRAEMVENSRSTGALERDLHVTTRRGQLDITFGTVQPYAGWWEFGGGDGRPPPREYIPAGRTLFPTLAEQRSDIQVEADLYISKLAIQLETNPPTRILG
jgi:hypothetical protein